MNNNPMCVYRTALPDAEVLPLDDFVPGECRSKLYVQNSDLYVLVLEGLLIIVHPGQDVWLYSWEHNFPVEAIRVSYKDLAEYAAPVIRERARPMARY